MKKLFVLAALVACCSFFTSSVNAQGIVRNYTDCDVLVKVAYGDIGSCDWEGFITVIVPANGQVDVGLPAGKEIVAAKGKYDGVSGCAFYVGQDCTQYDYTTDVDCSGGCGDYSVSFNPSIGIKIYN